MNKLISIVTPCYNEEMNIKEIYLQVKAIFNDLPNYRYEHIFIDNASKDRTVEILKELANADRNVKLIVNSRNFGHIRSPFYGLLQARGDAHILIAADLQDPPYMIKDFIEKWEQGFKIVLGVKTQSNESWFMFLIRKCYYNIVGKLSEIQLTKNSTGFGLYDKKIIEILRDVGDPYPYFRGLISEIGFESAKIEYTQPARKRGITKNNFYTLYDIAMLGITNHSKAPLRITTMMGFLMALFCFIVATGYFIAKIIFWDQFVLGMAPIVIGFFFLASVQLFFIGIIGEYIGNIFTQVKKYPLVIEQERVNFD